MRHALNHNSRPSTRFNKGKKHNKTQHSGKKKKEIHLIYLYFDKQSKFFFLSLPATEGGTHLSLRGAAGGKVGSAFPVTPFNIAFIY